MSSFLRKATAVVNRDGVVVMALAGCLLACGASVSAKTYYIHPGLGNDAAPGTNASAPWKTLAKANTVRLEAGDQVLLAAGQTFMGQLAFVGISGTSNAPVILSSYKDSGNDGGGRPIIDARGFVAGIHLKNSRQVRISDLAITADGGGMREGQPQAGMRCGVLIEANAAGVYGGYHLEKVQVKNVSFEEPGFVRPAEDVHTANGTLHYGWGIRFIVTSNQAQIRDVFVTDCEIENVNHTGLKFTASNKGLKNVKVQRLRVLHSGGPGVQMSGVEGGRFSEMYVNGSGSTNDTRNWGRGSGLWTWSTSDVIVEKSQFMNANGPGDSAGVHIDYNCRNIIVQYNLSVSNAGGFCEILGNNYNNTYRYNVSVNDGQRVKGKNGAFQEGKTFWLSGYTGSKSPRRGPYNTYFYNNTIYVEEGMAARIAVTSTAEGVLIANNIFHIKGSSLVVTGDQFRADIHNPDGLKNVVFENNLYFKPESWPRDSVIQDKSPRFGDPQFVNPGGTKWEDYIPRNPSHIRGKGIRIAPIPGDAEGLLGGLIMEKDILGNSVGDCPDIGAIQVP